MKRIVSLILCVFMLLSLITVTSAAETDAEVSYSLKIEASAPVNGETYSVGETVTLTVAVSTMDIMGNPAPELSAPVYGFNGALNYNSFLLNLTNVTKPAHFGNMIYKNEASTGRVTFSFLCQADGSSLSGINVGSEFVLAKFTFKTLKDGVSSSYLSDMIITDKEAGARPIISSTQKLDISIGTGEMVADAESLAKSIEDAQKQLDLAIMNPNGELVYPAFTVSQETYDALERAIENARQVLSYATFSDEFLEAETTLVNAIYAYENAKLYGKKNNDNSHSVGGIIVGEKDKKLVEVIAVAGGNGKIAAGYEKQLVRYGTSATVVAIPDEGYEVEKIVVNGLEYPGDETVTIASVTAKTQVEFYFRVKPKAPRFADVARGAWYFDAVEQIAEMGLFAGTSETEFSPEMPMTRAMLVTVLHRLDGKPSAGAEVMFKDVASDMWYTDAIAWASANGIVNGYNEETFGTNDSISRQDMVTILYRYLKYKGLTPADGVELDMYTDAEQISDYAKTAMEWANATGLVKGTSETTLSPKDNCTRAQVATIILRYTENISLN